MKSLTLKTALNILIISLLLSFSSFAQNTQADLADLEVMKEALKEVFLSSNPQPSMYHCKPASLSAAYQPGFGIILTTPTYLPSSRFNFQYNISGTATTSASGNEVGEKDQQALKDAIIDNMRFFLQNYGDLAFSLGSEEKIMVIYEGKNVISRFPAQGLTFSLDEKGHSQITAHVKKADIESFRKQQLTEAQLQERITIETSEEEGDADPSFKILANILKEHLGTLTPANEIEKGLVPVTSRNNNQFAPENQRVQVGYKVLNGFGVTYEIALVKVGGFFALAGVPKNKDDKKEQEEQAKKREEDNQEYDKAQDARYEAAKIMLAEDLVKYGRTLRALSPDDMITIQFQNAPCDACKSPATATFGIAVKDLQAFDRREIDLANAISRVSVVETGKASELRVSGWRVVGKGAGKVSGFGGNEE